MRAVRWFLPAILWTVPGPGCVSEDGGVTDEPFFTASGAKADGANDDLVLTASDDGRVCPVAEGQSVVVRLPSIPSTGYRWVVTRTVDAVGDPEEHYEPPAVPDGDGPGTAVLRWETRGSGSLVGRHAVTLAHQHPNPEVIPIETFSFIVDVLRVTSAREVVLDHERDGAWVGAVTGQEVVVRLPADPSTHYWRVIQTGATFGSPERTFEPSEQPERSEPGVAVLRWRTSPAMFGRHFVRLAYEPLAERDPVALEEFSFTVAIRSAVLGEIFE